MRRLLRSTVALSLVLAGVGADAKRAERVDLSAQSIELPGAPSRMISTDLDGDGRRDLLVVIVYTEWDQVGFSRIENMIEVTTVVPALFDRRELRLYSPDDSGVYREAAEPLPLPLEVLTIERGPPGVPALGLTDHGLVSVELHTSGETNRLVLRPILEEPAAIAGAATFFGAMRFVHDIDGDGIEDVMFPAVEGPAVYLGTGDGIATTPASRVRLPGYEVLPGHPPQRRYPMARPGDLDGDGTADLLTLSGSWLSLRAHVLRGRGDGTFDPPVTTRLDCLESAVEERDPAFSFLGDLDGDGVAELVTQIEHDPGDVGMRKSLKAAKNPTYTFAIHAMGEDLRFEPTPRASFEVKGYPLEGDWINPLDRKFQDLDGDGRMDLVTMTLDFSILQAVRVITTKKVSIGLDFHVFAQNGDGTFRAVRGSDLSEKLKFDLNDLKFNRIAQFSGDFDGDGRIDFTHLGRGKKVTIHRGQEGAVYPDKPDLIVPLDTEIESIELVTIRDLDGDERADIAIVHPLPPPEVGASPPVRLDLYLSAEPEP